jgi:hypothetical protein
MGRWVGQDSESCRVRRRWERIERPDPVLVWGYAVRQLGTMNAGASCIRHVKTDFTQVHLLLDCVQALGLESVGISTDELNF